MVRDICREIDQMTEDEAQRWAEEHLFPVLERVRQRETPEPDDGGRRETPQIA